MYGADLCKNPLKISCTLVQLVPCMEGEIDRPLFAPGILHKAAD